MSTEDAIGRKVKPARYAGQARETIDRQRDMFRSAFIRRAMDEAPHTTMADAIRDADFAFATYCRATALKYEDRMGRKDAAPQERGKRDWYRQMANHVMLPDIVPDPRSERPDFEPYAPPSIPRVVHNTDRAQLAAFGGRSDHATYLRVHRACDEATGGDSGRFLPVLVSTLRRMGWPLLTIATHTQLPTELIDALLEGPIDTAARSVAEAALREE